MRYLALESSCDETAAAVVESREGRLFILSNAVASQVDTHRLFGGVVPEIASRAHIEAISSVTREALDTAGVTLSDIDAIGVTDHPGLIGALLVGVNFAKSLATAHSLPLVPVDHVQAHIAALYLTEEPPVPPFLALAASGGHTAFYLCDSYTTYHRLGGTRDDAIGEAFDTIGRLIGLPYPAGAAFDRLAAEGFCRAAATDDPREGYRKFKKTEAGRSPNYRLPSPALDGAPDLSFSGLKTAAVNLLHRFDQLGQDFDRAIFAAAYTYEAVEAVARKTDELLAAHPGLSFAVAGGVAANSHLRARLSELCEKRGVRLCLAPLPLCGDNGAMVAAQTHYNYEAGIRAGSDLNASAMD